MLDLKELHSRVQKGELAPVRDRILRAVDKGRFDRADAAALARLAMRAGAPELGLRILHRIVHPPPRVVAKATQAETAEYAICLVKSGALEEGEKLLSGIGEKDCPQASFYRAVAHVARWDYAEAIPCLRRYLATPGLSRYDRLVGQVNLAAALVFEGKFVPADALLAELLHRSSVEGHRLMLGRVLEISAESLIDQKRWDKAGAFLDHAEKRLATTGSADETYVRKFRAILALARRPGERRALAPLRAVREEAQRAGLWETVRHCDRAEAVLLQDEALLARVFFGTPYPAFREKLLLDYGSVPERLLESYDWCPGGEGRGDCREGMDLLSGRLFDGKAGLKPGTLPHRLMVALTSDGYRPLRIAELFARLHPDLRFNPFSSRPIVHNAVLRVRLWLKERGIALEIAESKGGYRLAGRGKFAIRISSSALQGRRYSAEIGKLRTVWPSASFSSGEAEQLLGLPCRTAYRLLQSAVEDGLLAREGRSRGTRYRFLKTASRK